MFTEKDSQGRYLISDMTVEDAEIISTAVTRILPDLPLPLQSKFRRILIEIDRILPKDYDTTTSN